MNPPHRQLQLFPTTGYFAARLGADFFNAVPTSPGVYFFYGEEDRLLYIGQSKNLRKRMGSYRFVNIEKHSKRIVRMVRRIQRADWRVCETGSAAILLEKELLLEHRPPFNRAGVWIPPPWWLAIELDGASLAVRLIREPEEEVQHCLGPLPSGGRYVLGAMMRLMHRWQHPSVALWDFPLGMLRDLAPLSMRLPVSEDANSVLAELVTLLSGGVSVLPVRWEEEIAAMPESPEKEFWAEQCKQLVDWRSRICMC